MDVLNVLNHFMWAAGNLLLAYTSIVLLVFVVAYYIIFDPNATTGGRLIFQFMLSLLGVIILVFIGIFVNPSIGNGWDIIPVNVELWRPALRFLVYGFVAYSVTSLVTLLILRKWFPEKLIKASDLDLVRPRGETIDFQSPKTTVTSDGDDKTPTN